MLRYDSPLMETLSKAADYVLLNLLCLLCCLPVLTIGASMTAKYAVSMKIERGEEPAVCRSFLEAFKRNFGQVTVLWLFLGLALGFLAVDWVLIFRQGTGNWSFLFLLLLGIFSYLALGCFFSLFPLIARFSMKSTEALKGALLFSLTHLPRTLLGLGMMAAPYVISLWYMNWALGIYLIGTAIALYENSRMFVKVFGKLEEQSLRDSSSQTEPSPLTQNEAQGE